MSERFTYEGFDFIMELEPDNDGAPPWENDGHGVVSEWRARDSKRPGERIFHKDGGSCRFYDWQATMLKARKEGWGVEKPPPSGLTKRAIAALAAEEDFERMRRWCNDEWWYVRVVVTLDEYDSEAQASCGGIESDCEDFIKEVRNSLAAELLPDNRMERFMRKAAAT